MPRQLIMLALTACGFLLLVLLIPMSDVTRGQILALLGLVLTGVVGLSSTTFVSNIMAGLMLRVVKSFRPGDFIRVHEQFGRVTERGLVHTEIQTEDRDLTTFPNLHLVTHPITVVRSSGTIVSTTLSLGYDIPQKTIEGLLKTAAEKVNLQDPFVQIKDLGNFSVTYRVAGFLSEVKHLLSVRSDLRKMVIDSLHENDIEIVSPSFMNQRQLPEGQRIIPHKTPSEIHNEEKDTEETPEKLIFDKAEQAEMVEKLRTEYKNILEKLDALNKEKKSADADEKDRLTATILVTQRLAERLSKQLEDANRMVEAKKDEDA